MTIDAKVVLDSVAPNGARLTTFELTYPRFIHAELMTHREFSRNAASSRAIPTPKKIERIRQDCAKPSEWGVNQKGMQAAGSLSDIDKAWAERTWSEAKDESLRHAEILCGLRCASCKVLHPCFCETEVTLDLHKQVANRILEPFDHITVVLSTTKLKNHFKLRLECDPTTGRPFADPTYFELATKWKAAYDQSTPKLLQVGEWHLPYVTTEDLDQPLESLQAISVGRCARVSYLRQGQGDVEENVKLHDRLASSGHWSPFEHVATPIGGVEFLKRTDEFDPSNCGYCQADIAFQERFVQLTEFKAKPPEHSGSYEAICIACARGHVTSGNFHGWTQYRKQFANEAGGD